MIGPVILEISVLVDGENADPPTLSHRIVTVLCNSWCCDVHWLVSARRVVTQCSYYLWVVGRGSIPGRSPPLRSPMQATQLIQYTPTTYLILILYFRLFRGRQMLATGHVFFPKLLHALALPLKSRPPIS